MLFHTALILALAASVSASAAADTISPRAGPSDLFLECDTDTHADPSEEHHHHFHHHHHPKHHEKHHEKHHGKGKKEGRKSRVQTVSEGDTIPRPADNGTVDGGSRIMGPVRISHDSKPDKHHDSKDKPSKEKHHSKDKTKKDHSKGKKDHSKGKKDHSKGKKEDSKGKDDLKGKGESKGKGKKEHPHHKGKAKHVDASVSRNSTVVKLSSFASSALSRHNHYRALYSAPALTWSPVLAKKAASWASACHFVHSQGKLGPYGENIAAGQPNISAVVDAWVNGKTEAPAYNPKKPVASHFTQVVWKATKKVGCAAHVCPGIAGLPQPNPQFYVCEYSPAGNVYPASNFLKNVGKRVVKKIKKGPKKGR